MARGRERLLLFLMSPSTNILHLLSSSSPCGESFLFEQPATLSALSSLSRLLERAALSGFLSAEISPLRLHLPSETSSCTARDMLANRKLQKPTPQSSGFSELRAYPNDMSTLSLSRLLERAALSGFLCAEI